MPPTSRSGLILIGGNEGKSGAIPMLRRVISENQAGWVAVIQTATSFSSRGVGRRHDTGAGTLHQGADDGVLENPGGAAGRLRRDLLPGGSPAEITDREVRVTREGEVARAVGIESSGSGSAVVEELAPLLPGLLTRYERC